MQANVVGKTHSKAAAEGQSSDLSADIERITNELSLFLTSNPLASIVEKEGSIIVKKPWGDDSLEFDITGEPQKLIAILNDLYFPPALTAIFHKSSGDLEIIYTPYAGEETRNRSFDLLFDGKTIRCEFAPPSEALFSLAAITKPVGPPHYTDYRNLQEFTFYLKDKADAQETDSEDLYDPSSFWIRRIEWDEAGILSLVKHLNFYMTYFDKDTPRILIHREVSKEQKRITSARYPCGKFPTVINGKTLDPYLLGVWESAHQATDVYRRYLYFYQMLEYAAFYYIQNRVVSRVERVLSSPETASNTAAAAHKIMDALIEDKMQDEAKIAAIIEDAVEPESLWREIEPNKTHFSQEVIFDGGFKLRPIIKPNAEFEDFVPVWSQVIPTSLRRIRNALVHAREARMADVIAPTRENYGKLAPWIQPLRVAVLQVTIFMGR